MFDPDTRWLAGRMLDGVWVGLALVLCYFAALIACDLAAWLTGG
jgi:hypothetical protein